MDSTQVEPARKRAERAADLVELTHDADQVRHGNQKDAQEGRAQEAAYLLGVLGDAASVLPLDWLNAKLQLLVLEVRERAARELAAL